MSENRYLLCVDDEENILKALKRELHGWVKERGLIFLTAKSGEEALKILAEKGDEVAIVVSDFKMPFMKGSDLLMEVKKQYPQIITLMLTGFSELEETRKTIQEGIFSIIQKPWEENSLKEELQKAFEAAI